jgi:hypothetical protein
MPATALPQLTAEYIVSEYEKYKSSKRRGGTLATANWPTVLANQCEAYAVYMRTVPPERRRKIGTDLAMIFEEGNEQHRIVKRDLAEAGFECSDEETQAAWPKYQISGRKDLKIWKHGYAEKLNVEVKSCSPYTFDAINSADDLKKSSKDWLVKWWKQVSLYQVLIGVERYLMLLKNKSTGAIKIIEFHLDDEGYQAAEAMLKKAERVNHLVQIGEPPSPAQKLGDADVCCECEFFDTCLPEIAFGPGATVLSEEEATELSAQLDRREALEPAKREFDQIDREVKGSIKALALGGTNKVVAEEWIATVKDVGKDAYTVPAHMEKHISFFRVGQEAAKGGRKKK